ncbi:MAG: right-handed parallel beta-helix repeat-containing protein [Methanobrevibacter sp.]|nr:right-handed parallel beta-helix repeat-containing protein [Methanobrevibacter sp.]
MIYKNQRRMLLLFLLVFSLFMIMSSVAAKDVAINSATNFKSTIEGSGVASGDVVLLTNPSSPGYFNLNSSNVNITINKNVTIRSAVPSQRAILDLNSHGRAFTVTSSGSLTLINVTIRNGYAYDSSGGAISVNSGGRASLTGCNFTNNRVQNPNVGSSGMSYANGGGAIYNAGNLTINNCNFTSNSATGSFWGMSFTGYAYYVRGGGAIWNNAGNLNVSDSIFNSNAVSRFDDGGAAIYMMSAGVVNVNRCNFTNNVALNYAIVGANEYLASQNESAIYRWSGTFNVSNCNFILNNLPGSPIMGTINTTGNNYYISNTTSSIKDALSKVFNGDTIYLNPGTYNGTNNWNITINKNVTIRGNGSASNVIIDGQNRLGSIFNVIAGYKLTLIGLTVTRGNAFAGGAIFNSGTIDLTNCTFRNNTATSYGGVIENYGNLTITNCNFTNNSILSGTGGVIYNNMRHSLTITNCTFTNNTASNGGAIYNGGNASLTNCTFTNNTASNGGAINNGGNANLTGCTFMNNSATYGGAIHTTAGILNVTYSVFFNNTGSSPIYRSSGTCYLNDNFYFWVITNISDTTYINTLKNNVTNYVASIGSFYYLSISGYKANYGVSETAIVISTLARNGTGTDNRANLPTTVYNINIRYTTDSILLNTNYNYKNQYNYTIPTTTLGSGYYLQFYFGNTLLRQLSVAITQGTTNLAVNTVSGANVGEPIQITATLTAYGKGVTGNVRLFVNGILKDTRTTDANGRVTFTYTPTTSDPQSSSYYVDYMATTNYLPSYSLPVSFTVTSYNYGDISSEISVSSSIVDSSKYTSASWDKFQTALNVAKAMLNDKSANSQADIDACLKALEDARKGLIFVGTGNTGGSGNTGGTGSTVGSGNTGGTGSTGGTGNVGGATKKNVDLIITKVKRVGNNYKITVKNLGKDKSGKTKLKVWYKIGKKTFSKIVNVKAIVGGKTRIVNVKFFKYSTHKKIKKTAQVNYNKMTYEKKYNNNKFTIKKG